PNLTCFDETYHMRCSIHVHVSRQQLAVCLPLDDCIVEIVEQPLDAYFFIIGIRVDCTKFFGDLDQFPLKERGALEGKLEDAGHVGGFKGQKEVADVRGPDLGGETQQDPVRVQFDPDCCPVPCRDQDREHTAERFVCLVAGAYIADHA